MMMSQSARTAVLCVSYPALRRKIASSTLHAKSFSAAAYSRTPTPGSTSYVDVAKLLEKPSWSVTALLPSEGAPAEESKISVKQLRHLCRLSALPEPKSQLEEAAMVRSLENQLSFVRAVKQVDTTGVEPLVAIRDETVAGRRERTISVETLKSVLANEEFTGRTRRPRRRKGVLPDTSKVEAFDIRGMATRTIGNYFVVDSSDPSMASSSTKD